MAKKAKKSSKVKVTKGPHKCIVCGKTCSTSHVVMGGSHFCCDDCFDHHKHGKSKIKACEFC